MKKILTEDYEILCHKIKELEMQIFALGDEFHEAVNQSSETWHDNAPFDTVRDKQSLLNSELQVLKTMRSEASKVVHSISKKVKVGSALTLQGPKTIKLIIGGHWVGRVKHDEHTVISCDSPVALALIGKKLDDDVLLPTGNYTVTQLD